MQQHAWNVDTGGVTLMMQTKGIVQGYCCVYV